MSINAINANSISATGTSTAQSNSSKTLEQRAIDGDPVAKAELKLENPQAQSSSTPSTEPGKGENVDKYV